jgi:hypothetical protein
MSAFVDRTIMNLANPPTLRDLVDPPTDTTHARIRALVSAVHDLPSAQLREVRGVTVRNSAAELPLFPAQRTQGTWTQTLPSQSRSDLSCEQTGTVPPQWLDVLAHLDVTLLLEVDPGEVDAIALDEVEGFTTLTEFRQHFRFIDLDDFMARHGISTVAELQKAFHYLRAEIKLKALPPFDPNDPANLHRFELDVAILVRDTVDVASTLRDAKLMRLLAERTVAFHREAAGDAQVRTPYAPLVIFPVGALPAPQRPGIVNFFASEQVVIVFV